MVTLYFLMQDKKQMLY